MTPITLQALRRLLFFSVDEAAELIGGVTPRSWQYWERGQRSIPEYVEEKMLNLVDWRRRTINEMVQKIDDLRRQDSEQRIALGWYPTRRSWLLRAERDPLIYWRPYCSALAEIAAADETISIMTHE